jgi:predicted TIM-barrel fold metal-dependent hydrolase
MKEDSPKHPWAGLRDIKLPMLDDAEGKRVPEGLRVFDAHVHLFPERVFLALWRWFETHAWPIRYRLFAEQVIAFLSERGVERMTALVYSHRPGMSQPLNAFVAELARAHSCVVPLGTVLPGEPDAAQVVREALGKLEMRGLKLHCHVQRVAPDDPKLFEVYALAEEMGKPVLIHSGKEPSVAGYGVDTRTLGGVAQIERVLQKFPNLKLVVPHLGADEFVEHAALLERYPNLWLDTTMVVSDYFPAMPSAELLVRHADRLLYGTDFPNIPFAWDRELRYLASLSLSPAQRTKLFWANAAELFGT